MDNAVEIEVASPEDLQKAILMGMDRRHVTRSNSSDWWSTNVFFFFHGVSRLFRSQKICFAMQMFLFTWSQEVLAVVERCFGPTKKRWCPVGRSQVAATKMNADSSRSHLIFIVTIECTNKKSKQAIGFPRFSIPNGGNQWPNQSKFPGFQWQADPL